MRLADDYEMWFRLASEGRLSFISEPLFQWRFSCFSLSWNEERHLLDLIYYYKKARKSKIGQKSTELINKNLAKYYARLGNFYLASKRYIDAKKIYNKSLQLNKKQKSLRIICSLSLICPSLASFLIRRKRKQSQKKTKIDPDWILLTSSK